MINKFIVVSQPRSGSTFFCNQVLRTSPDVWCFDSLFSQNKPSAQEYLEEIGLEKYSGSEIGRYLDDHYKKAFNKYGKNHVGFKLFKEDIDIESYNYLLTNGDFKIILLHRKNVLRSVVSLEIALITGQWHPRERDYFDPFDINIDQCRKRIEKYKFSINYTKDILEKNAIEYFEIEYNEIFEIDKVNNALLFLGTNTISSLPEWNEPLNSPVRYRLINNISEVEEILGTDENGYLFEK